MRDCSSALATFLGNQLNRSCLMIDLYTIKMVDGTVYRFTAGNAAITVPSAGFPADCQLNYGADRTFALGPGFGRSRISSTVGIQPSELKIDVMARSTDLIGTFTFAQAAQLRFFDGAVVELDRFFAPTPPASGIIDTSLGCMIWFYGRVAEIVVGRSKVAMTVKSMMNLLQVQQSPPRLFEAACGFLFGGARCGYDRVAGLNALGASTGIGQITVTADTGSTTKTVNLTAPMSLDYRLGTATGATGNNTGFIRTVNDNGSGSQLALARDLPFTPIAGDTFTVLPGCDHTLGGAQGCTGRLNQLRYGGMPYIPPPELAV